MAGVSVAWIVPFFLGAIMFPGPALAETVRISGTGGAIGGMRLLAEAFRKAEPGVDVIILPSLGSSGGIRAVLAGRLDIGLSARPLSPEEMAQGPRQTAYARTAFVFAVNPDVKRSDITLAEVIDIYCRQEDDLGGRDRPAAHSPPGRRHGHRLTAEYLRGDGQCGATVAETGGADRRTTDQHSADVIERTSGSFGTTTLALVVSGRGGSGCFPCRVRRPRRNPSGTGRTPTRRRFSW